MSELPSEANRAALYNALIYFNEYYDKSISSKFGDIVKSLDDDWEIIRDDILDSGGSESEVKNARSQIDVLIKACERDKILSGAVLSGMYRQDNELGRDDGLNACCFREENGTYQFVYRGTNTGEWLDNGDGLSGIPRTDARNDIYSSRQQELAVEAYYELSKGMPEDARVVLSGHSKGGNNAQYVNMNIDRAAACYSFDGQGFSPEEIEHMRQTLGEDEFELRRQKMYSIAADNDYVNILGIRLIPQDHVFYLKTTEEYIQNNIFYNHQAHAYLSEDGSFNPTTEQGPLSAFLQQTVLEIMALDPAVRENAVRAVMRILQDYVAGGPAIYGETVDWDDFISGLCLTTAYIVKNLLATEAGHNVIAYLWETYKIDLLKAIDNRLRSSLPGFDTVSEKIHAILSERDLTSWEEIRDYIMADPIENTLDLLVPLLSDWETVTALCSMTAVITIVMNVIVLLLPLVAFIAEVVAVLASLLVVFTVVKLAVDFLKTHWDEIMVMLRDGIEAMKQLAHRMIQQIRKELEAAINALLQAAKRLYQLAGEVWKNVQEGFRVIGGYIQETLQAGLRIISTVGNTLVRTVFGVLLPSVTINMSRLQSAVGKMDALAGRVQRLDQRLDTLYGRLAISNIEESEGVFTSLLNMYHLVRADINVDEGNRIRRMANNLSELFLGYQDVEKWVKQFL